MEFYLYNYTETIDNTTQTKSLWECDIAELGFSYTYTLEMWFLKIAGGPYNLSVTSNSNQWEIKNMKQMNTGDIL